MTSVELGAPQKRRLRKERIPVGGGGGGKMKKKKRKKERLATEQKERERERNEKVESVGSSSLLPRKPGEERILSPSSSHSRAKNVG